MIKNNIVEAHTSWFILSYSFNIYFPNTFYRDQPSFSSLASSSFTLPFSLLIHFHPVSDSRASLLMSSSLPCQSLSFLYSFLPPSSLRPSPHVLYIRRHYHAPLSMIYSFTFLFHSPIHPVFAVRRPASLPESFPSHDSPITLLNRFG